MFHNETLNRAQVFQWHKAFKNGCESVTDEWGRVRALVQQNSWLTVRQLAEKLNLKYETVRF